MSVALVHAPVDLSELVHIARGLAQTLEVPAASRDWVGPTEIGSADVPPPRFSRAVVSRVALSTPAMRCECPHHLADIVSSLLAFERYSLECENRNAEDAATHHYLAVTAGQCRAAFEEALAHVAQQEGISLEEV